MTDQDIDWDTLVEKSPAETRVAVVDSDGLMRRFCISRMNNESPVGSIYRAKVTKNERSTGGAFLDLGDPDLGTAFLPKLPKNLTEGQSTIVQVIRAPEGNKGSAITTKPVIRGRYVTYYPTGGSGTVDRRCGQGRRRAELEAILGKLHQRSGGLMINWAAIAVTEEVIDQELRKLLNAWQSICIANDETKRPGVLMSAPDAVSLAMLDAPPEGRVAVNDRCCYASLKKEVDTYWPDMQAGLLFHKPAKPIFASAGIDAEIDALCERIVPIPGGGSLSIDRVEAMTVVDVNLADTSIAPDGFSGTVKLNLRAAAEVARQIELRNLSGLIVVDFVSMRNKEDRKKIVDATRRALRNAVTPTDVLGITAAGLVEITRQRNGPSLSEQLLATAPQPTSLAEADAAAILRTLTNMMGAGRPTVKASKRVLEILKTDFKEAVLETEGRIGQSISFEEKSSSGWEALLQR